jgi:hypothetical protein
MSKSIVARLVACTTLLTLAACASPTAPDAEQPRVSAQTGATCTPTPTQTCQGGGMPWD